MSDLFLHWLHSIYSNVLWWKCLVFAVFFQSFNIINICFYEDIKFRTQIILVLKIKSNSKNEKYILSFSLLFYLVNQTKSLKTFPISWNGIVGGNYGNSFFSLQRFFHIQRVKKPFHFNWESFLKWCHCSILNKSVFWRDFLLKNYNNYDQSWSIKI